MSAKSETSVKLETALEEYNRKRPCPKGGNHKVKWYTGQHFVPGLFEDEVKMLGYCKKCNHQIEAIWKLHNIIGETMYE